MLSKILRREITIFATIYLKKEIRGEIRDKSGEILHFSIKKIIENELRSYLFN